MYKKEKSSQNTGITLISLVITIIIMLILVAVSISMAVNGGLFNYAGKAVGDTENAIDKEKELANGRIKVGDKWYDSIDDYLNGIESTGVKITLSISEGTKVAEKDIPVPTGFKHTEGTIDDGYVIQDTDGNEFVWVPVNKDQKITLSVKSEENVELEECTLYDPAGKLMLTLNSETGYEKNNIEPNLNGMYIAVVKTTEGKIIQKTLIVKSLYAFDTGNDTNEEYVRSCGYDSIKEYVETKIGKEVEEFLTENNAPTLEVALSVYRNKSEYYTERADYRESVNNAGGFYIGRYEAGTTTLRTSGSSSATLDDLISASGKPVSKEGTYPYNHVTYSQAKDLAESMYDNNNSENNFKVSLPEGRAWDRTLGWIYETKAKTASEIYLDSTTWGNYYNAEFTITKGKYSENYGQTFTDVLGEYPKENGKPVLLTTGTTQRNSSNKIYDLAGNVWEWASEAGSSGNRVFRGGVYNDEGCTSPACYRYNDLRDSYYRSIGFRCALYIK